MSRDGMEPAAERHPCIGSAFDGKRRRRTGKPVKRKRRKEWNVAKFRVEKLFGRQPTGGSNEGRKERQCKVFKQTNM